MYNSKIYIAMEWVMRFAYIQLLWIAFTVLGLIVLGFSPSTTAAFSVIRRWQLGETDIPVFKTYWKYYRQEFFKSNLLGLFAVAGILLVIFNFTFVEATSLVSLSAPHVLMLGIILFYLIFLLYLFPAFVHFEGSVFKVMKTAFLIMLISPLHTLLMLLSVSALLVIFYAVPALAFVLGITSFIFITSLFALKAFQKVRKIETL